MSASAILRLQKAGFTAEQVEALADFMDTQAASKADLEAAVHKLDLAISESRADAKADVVSVRGDFAALRADFAGMQADLKLLEQRMTIKLGTMVAIAIGIVAAMVKLL
ncbi:MAG: hypothetical protein HQL38_13840 [Alphaproteobacteria bacterium]|nr:hypothetical protein [Alphaproteobacteria bacterium]MBF0393756.1 hypothetical protein [Alphaproteobacteria bacterium]